MALFCYRALPFLILPRIVMPASPLAFTHTVTERFLRYVVIDTQSDPASPTCPSTEKQKNLGRLLAAELQAMGLATPISTSTAMSMRRSRPIPTRRCR